MTNEEVKDLCFKIQFLLNNYVRTEDNKFTFPDGDTWDIHPCNNQENYEIIRLNRLVNRMAKAAFKEAYYMSPLGRKAEDAYKNSIVYALLGDLNGL